MISLQKHKCINKDLLQKHIGYTTFLSDTNRAHLHTYTRKHPVRAEHLHGNPHHTGGRCHTSRFTMETLPLDEGMCVLMSLSSCVFLSILYYSELFTYSESGSPFHVYVDCVFCLHRMCGYESERLSFPLQL